MPPGCRVRFPTVLFRVSGLFPAGNSSIYGRLTLIPLPHAERTPAFKRGAQIRDDLLKPTHCRRASSTRANQFPRRGRYDLAVPADRTSAFAADRFQLDTFKFAVMEEYCDRVESRLNDYTRA